MKSHIVKWPIERWSRCLSLKGFNMFLYDILYIDKKIHNNRVYNRVIYFRAGPAFITFAPLINKTIHLTFLDPNYTTFYTNNEILINYVFYAYQIFKNILGLNGLKISIICVFYLFSVIKTYINVI